MHSAGIAEGSLPSIRVLGTSDHSPVQATHLGTSMAASTSTLSVVVLNFSRFGARFVLPADKQTRNEN